MLKYITIHGFSNNAFPVLNSYCYTVYVCDKLS